MHNLFIFISLRFYYCSKWQQVSETLLLFPYVKEPENAVTALSGSFHLI